MKTRRSLLFILAAALVLPMPLAHALPPPNTNLGPTTGPVYLCVNPFLPLPNVRMVADPDDCLPFEFLQVIDTLSAIGVVCETENTDGNGGFNIDAICPAGDVVLSGGYSCATDSTFRTPSPATLSENTFHFSSVTPNGWQSVGSLDSGTEGTCRVCATCTPGSCKDPNACAP